MSSHLPTVDGVQRRGATPLGVTLRRRWRLLWGVFLAVTVLAYAGDVFAGFHAEGVARLAGLAPPVDLLVQVPLEQVFLRLERASLVGLLVVTFLTPFVASRGREEVRLRRGRTAFAVSLLAGLVGALLGFLVGIDAVLALVATGWLDTPGVGGRFWLAELVVAVPVTVGVAAALPGAVVGATRSGLVGPRATTRQRWLAVLALLTFVAVYSPSDSLTFVLGAGVVLSGLATGVTLVEYDVV